MNTRFIPQSTRSLSPSPKIGRVETRENKKQSARFMMTAYQTPLPKPGPAFLLSKTGSSNKNQVTTQHKPKSVTYKSHSQNTSQQETSSQPDENGENQGSQINEGKKPHLKSFFS
ncbi:MAG: hypothetical protein ACON4R_08555 [Akkermansiaceae bacterium]